MTERIHKVLARRGVASRRGAEDLIRGGLVTVNGEPASLGQTVTDSDVIRVRGRMLAQEQQGQYFALNKPAGYVTSRRSTHGEQTVVSLLPPGLHLNPVGRLDKDSSGLLLLTNDGEWANLVTHPRYEIEKEYQVEVRGQPREESLERLRGGIRLRDATTTAPARIERLAAPSADAIQLSVTVIEGKKRQIREMFAAIGNPVVSLTRVRIGAVELGGLAVGDVRRLHRAEVESIREQARGASKGRTRAEASGRD